MKKKCKFCGTLVKCNGNIEKDEEKGRGIYCDVCGGFIEVPKQINRNNGVYSKYTGRSWNKSCYRRKKERMQKITLIIALIMLIPMIFLIFNVYNNYITVPDYSLKYSTFMVVDNETSYDISTTIKLSIYVSKDNISFDTEADLKNLTNFEKIINAIYAIDITVDFIVYKYIWVEINANNELLIYNNTFVFTNGGINHEYYLKAYRIK